MVGPPLLLDKAVTDGASGLGSLSTPGIPRSCWAKIDSSQHLVQS